MELSKNPEEMTALELLEVYEMWYLSNACTLTQVWSDHPEYRPQLAFPYDMREVRKRLKQLKREELKATEPSECAFDHSNYLEKVFDV